MDVFHREEAAGRASFDVGDLVIKHLVSKSEIFKSGKTEIIKANLKPSWIRHASQLITLFS